MLVMVSYVNERDDLHERSIEVLNGLKSEMVTSDLVIVELASVFSRVTGASGEELEALVEYTLTKIGAEIIEVNWMYVFSLVRELAGDPKLRTLDLLHITAAFLAGTKIFLTFDRGILFKGEVVGKFTGLRVLG